MIDFASSGYAGDEAATYKYMPPEYGAQIEKAKKPKLSNPGDAFALGVMIADILTGFKYWEHIKDVQDYSNSSVAFPEPEGVEVVITSKLKGLLEKVPGQRSTISSFSEFKMFKSMTLKRVMTISDTKPRSAQSVDALDQPQKVTKSGDTIAATDVLSTETKKDDMGLESNNEIPNSADPFGDGPIPAPIISKVSEKQNNDSDSPAIKSNVDVPSNTFESQSPATKSEVEATSNPFESPKTEDKAHKAPEIVTEVSVIDNKRPSNGSSGSGKLSPVNFSVVDYSRILAAIDKSDLEMSFDMNAYSGNSSTAEQDNKKSKGFVPPEPIPEVVINSPMILGSRPVDDEGSETGSINLPEIIVPIKITPHSVVTYEDSPSPKPKVPSEASKPKPPTQASKPKSRVSEIRVSTVKRISTPNQKTPTQTPKKKKKTKIEKWLKKLSSKTKIAIVAILLLILVGSLIGGLLSARNNSNSLSTNTSTATTTAVPVYENNVVVSRFVGTGIAGLTNGIASVAQFNTTGSIAFDSLGNAFVSDSNNNLIRKITTAGAVSTFAGDGTVGSLDGTGTTAQFSKPVGLYISPTDDIYVADSRNHRIRRITPAGVVTTFAGSSQGLQDGLGTAAMFYQPYAIAADPLGNLIIADASNSRIRSITPAGQVTTIAGSSLNGSSAGYSDGSALSSRFYLPLGVAVDSNGTIYVSDSYNVCIRKISNGTVSTLAGVAGRSGFSDGNSTTAKFSNPQGIAVDANGILYVADSLGNRVRKISPNGNVTTLAGNGTLGNLDGTGPNSMFNGLTGVYLRSQTNLMVADAGNHVIRNITFL